MRVITACHPGTRVQITSCAQVAAWAASDPETARYFTPAATSALTRAGGGSPESTSRTGSELIEESILLVWRSLRVDQNRSVGIAHQLANARVFAFQRLDQVALAPDRSQQPAVLPPQFARFESQMTGDLQLVVVPGFREEQRA